MLLQFCVANFRSFREEAVLNLVPDQSDSQHRDHMLPTVEESPKGVLRLAALYGANASGKSNLIDAVRFAKDLIIHGTSTYEAIPVVPFKLRKGSIEDPSTFEFVFIAGGMRYTYGMTVDSTRVHEEWLFSAGARGDVRLFERATSESGVTSVEFGERLLKLRSNEAGHQPGGRRRPGRKAFLDFVAEGTRSNQLFLTEASSRNVSEIGDVMTWFQDTLWAIPSDPNARIERLVGRDKGFATALAGFLQQGGTGVQSVEHSERNVDIEQLCASWPEKDRAEFERAISNLNPSEELVVSTPLRERLIISKSAQGNITASELRLGHRGEGGAVVPLNIREESDGTQRLIHLFPLLELARTGEHVIFLDELDLRLHPFLSKLMIDLFAKSPTRSQLVFTTHETYLLDLTLLRRDEIWFVEKDRTGSSELKCLAEYNVRPDLKTDRAYLMKRFGGVPAISRALGFGAAQPSEDLEVGSVARS